LTSAVGAGLEPLLRELAPQVLGILVRRTGDFSAAEDATQEALLAAASQWPGDGVPENPRAWLVQVARRRLADDRRAEIARQRRETYVVAHTLAEEEQVPSPDGEGAGERDDTLPLLFMCCHPALSRTSAVALTLRAVGGLTTLEIARAYFVPEATMAQRISRAKQAIKASEVPFEVPEERDLAGRLATVCHVLYLVFNEGYAASAGAELTRVDLSAEAIRLARLVHRLAPSDGEVTGLLALLLLTDARRLARTDSDGGIVPLDEQDRGVWDPRLVREGCALLMATTEGEMGPYAIQARIAATHDLAPTVEDTDWSRIRELYETLLVMSDNPMARLSHAIAVAMVEGPAAGLRLLDTLAKDPRWAESHRLGAARGHLFERAGDRASAIAHYRAAASATASAPERSYLLAKAAKLEVGAGGGGVREPVNDD